MNLEQSEKMTRWLLFGILIQFLIGTGNAMYFSQSEINLSRTFLPSSGFLYLAKAIVNRDEDGQISYGISKPQQLNNTKKGKCPDLRIDRNLGTISVVLSKEGDRGEMEPVKIHCKYRIYAKLEENGISPKEAIETTLHLHAVWPLNIISKSSDCSDISKKEFCFAGASQLNLRVMENAPVTPVAYLGSLPGLCEDVKISYNVSIADGVLSSGKTTGYEHLLTDVLTTSANLDRELIEMYNFSLTCILESKEKSVKIDVIRIEGLLNILDENDNVPVDNTAEKPGNFTVHISLSDHNYDMRPGKRIYTKDHSLMLSRDFDTPSVNQFKVYSLNDTKKLYDFDVRVMPVSTKGLINSTAMITSIYFSDHVTNVLPWKGYYCVLAVLEDTAVIPSKKELSLNYTICLNWGTKGLPSTPTQDLSQEDLLNRLSTRVTTANLPRSVQKHAPVLYPFPDIVEDVSDTVSGLEFTLKNIYGSYATEESLEGNGSIKGVFFMTNSSYLEVFEVTPKMGIIYIANPTLLSHTPFKSLYLEMLCNSSTIPSFLTNITIHLEEKLSNETCDELCSVYSDSKSCESSCGFGSFGKCRWRYKNPVNNSLSNEIVLDEDLDSLLEQNASYSNTSFYPTCSPHLDSCPDGKCDELEQLFPNLCPQDCAEELHGLKLIHRSNGKVYGIDPLFCKGVGSCQSSQVCSCAPVPTSIFDVDTSISPETWITQTEQNTASNPAQNECGPQCVVTILAIFIIVSAAFGFLFYKMKASYDRKRKSRSLNQSVMMTANGIELGYGDNTLISDVEYGMPRHHASLFDDQFSPNQVIQVESKWEIAREAMFLEHVLGEGQFGRVLKGKLYGHSGAHIPVAVKILKVDATEGSKSLWQEFMAEFSLLKQVDHPNVIKLLGACTTSGGPPYLVMEYAEYGALRSFLRKCRRVEKINGSNPALHWDNSDLSPVSGIEHPLDSEYVVTPREVLGFSWQIAKGMAYLSDMKMVHRDLAARNILLTKLKVCKISDFGLTRDIYVDDAYQKKSKDRVPVKWLAPECLADELYTTKSDVWAFGILVWELTTLGASPYPGIQTEQLYSLLNTGFRMPQPHNCSNELYSLMRRCWAYQPTNRPTFHQIVLELSKMLEDGIEYLKLDVPSVSNPGYDYFSQQDTAGSEVVNLSPPADFPEARQMSRRKLSMENLRLIDYEISTDDGFLSKRHSKNGGLSKHTYINDPTPSTSEQDCGTSSSNQKPVVLPSSSGYESPIKHSASIAV